MVLRAQPPDILDIDRLPRVHRQSQHSPHTSHIYIQYKRERLSVAETDDSWNILSVQLARLEEGRFVLCWVIKPGDGVARNS
jgi:hypothetical protein